jgi:hypothetical protein
MCNIITYQFACPHRVRRRRSPCHGAKLKPASSNLSAPRVACIAECFLTVYLRTPCNECNHKIWDTTWQAKVSRADAYLSSLREQHNSAEAIQTIEALRQEVEERRKAEEWALRHSITLLPARHVPRVKHRPFLRSPSSLGAEVKPEDVREGNKAWKDWSEMKEEDYDDDYVASTDPIHPVTTDYRFPGEGEDDEWVKQYLADGIEEAEVDDGGESAGWHDSDGWDWGDGKEEGVNPVEKQTDESDGRDQPDIDITSITEPSLSSTTSSSTPGNKISEADLDSMIADFWSHVNLASTPTVSPTSRHLDEEAPSPPPTTPPWIDGTHDAPLTVTQTLDSTPSSTNLSSQPSDCSPQRTQYDTHRRLLIRRKDVDEGKFYRDWLIVSRCEIREYEGSGEGGRKIVEPSKERR